MTITVHLPANMETFTFLTPTVGEFEECLQATGKSQLLRNEVHGYCLLL